MPKRRTSHGGSGGSTTPTPTPTPTDTTPDAFSFTAVTGAALGVPVTGAPITVSGITSPASISVVGGRYSLDGVTYTSIAGVVSNGAQVWPEVTSSALNLTATTATLTIGGVSATFRVTTRAADPVSGVVVTSTVELEAAMEAATGGETFLVAPGNYTEWNMRGNVYASEVLVTAQDRGDLPVFANIFLREMEKVRVSFVEVVLTAPSADAVTLQDCVDCTFEDSLVHGPSADLATILTTVKCIFIRTCTNTVVQRNECKWTSHGISHLACDFLDILDNRCHDLQSDGIRGGGSNDVNVERNYITNLYPPTSATHPDGIQFWTTNVTRLTERLVIRDNLFVRGAGRYAQGIFLRDQVGSGYDDVLIEGNAIVGGTYNGINPQGYAYPTPVGKVGFTNCVINDNLCLGYADLRSSIYFRAVASGSYADNHYSSLLFGTAGSHGPISDGGGNVQLVTTTPVGDLTILNAWRADHPDVPAP